MDKAKLFTPRLPEGEVEIPGVGTVRVRGLSRAEVLTVQGLKRAEADAHMVACGMVDPPMSVTEVKEWAKASLASEIEAVAKKIAELSGILEGAQKSGVPELRDEP